MGGLGSLLLITAGILIYNAIRLTILARRREIRIMELVGASHFTIARPLSLRAWCKVRSEVPLPQC